MSEPVIDSHLHVWSEDTETYPRSETPFPAPPELLQYMDEACVDRAVFVLPNYYGYDNRYLVDTVREYGGKFAGVGAVDPRAGVADRLAEPSSRGSTACGSGARGRRMSFACPRANRCGVRRASWACRSRCCAGRTRSSWWRQ